MLCGRDGGWGGGGGGGEDKDTYRWEKLINILAFSSAMQLSRIQGLTFSNSRDFCAAISWC